MDMKLIPALIVVAVLLAAGAAAEIDVMIGCPDDICVEGKDLNITVRVINQGERDMYVNSMYIVDINTDVKFWQYTPKDPTVGPASQKDFSSYTMAQLPEGANTLQYKGCGEVREYNDDHVLESKTSCSNIKSVAIVPLSEIECQYDGECADGEHCSKEVPAKCIPLECSEGEIIVKHRCVELDCGAFGEVRDGGCGVLKLKLWATVIITAALLLLMIRLLYRKNK